MKVFEKTRGDMAASQQKVRLQEEGRETNVLGKRLLAGMVDMLIVGIISYIIGWVLMHTSLLKPPAGTVISLLILYVYVTLANSSSRGASIGKMFFSLGVVDKNGNNLTFKQAAWRYGVLLIPYAVFRVLNDAGLILFGFFDGLMWVYWLTIIYFPLTDPRRRAFHDLLTSTYVKGDLDTRELNVAYPANRKRVFVVLSSLMVAVIMGVSISTTLSGGFYFNINPQITADVETLQQTANDIQLMDGVNKVGMTLATSNGLSSIKVEVIVDDISESPDLYDRIYAVLQQKAPGLLKKVDHTDITLESGFDMMFASAKKSSTKTYK
ncbi:MAG: RDD family protein [Flavobacteriales bacterium]|nr:RDD family protein [Flavobacteriales bacterium]MCB9448646.1 RDD family protein [Flavobacteriales bacterium]